MTIRLTRTIQQNGCEIRRDAEVEIPMPDDFVLSQLIDYVEGKPLRVRTQFMPGFAEGISPIK